MHSSEPACRVVRAWRLRTPITAWSQEHRELACAWLQVAGTVAAWPAGPIAVERRFLVSSGRSAAREYLLAAADGEGVIASRRDLERSLDAITAPLRALLAADPMPARRIPDLLRVEAISDIAELEAPSPGEPATNAAHFEAAVRALAAARSGAVLAVGFASPLLAESEDGTVRAWARIGARNALPPAAVAELGAAFTARPAQWLRALSPGPLAAARARLGDPCAVTDPCDGGSMSSPAAAAAVASLPGPTPPNPSFARPVECVVHTAGATVGSVPVLTGGRTSLRLPWDARRHHTFIAGGSGTGKSTLCARLARDDFEAGRGVFLLDPHGDLADEVLALVPASREQVVVIDPSDPRTAAIDFLPPKAGADPARLAARVADAFEELWDPHGSREWTGPVFFRVITNSIEALLTSRHAPRTPTLSTIERLIIDADFRSRIIDGLPAGRVRDRLVHDHRVTYRLGEGNPAVYVSSKLTPLLAGPAGNLLRQPARWSLEELIDAQGIVIFKPTVTELGSQGTRLVGRLMLSRLIEALRAQARRPPAERAAVSVIIDEAQLVADGRSLEILLTQGRKFGAAVTLANQAPSQLGPTLPSVLANCSNVALFRLPAREAALFADRSDFPLTRVVPQLPRFQASVLVEEQAPVLVETPGPVAEWSAAGDVLERAFARYGLLARPRNGVPRAVAMA